MQGQIYLVFDVRPIERNKNAHLLYPFHLLHQLYVCMLAELTSDLSSLAERVQSRRTHLFQRQPEREPMEKPLRHAVHLTQLSWQSVLE